MADSREKSAPSSAASWRGKDIMRSLPKRTHRIPTQARAEQREKFTLVSQFLAPIGSILKRYFGESQGFKSRRNLAISYHIREAVAGASPDFTMDYQKVIIAEGELLGPENPSAAPQATAAIKLDWEDNSGQGLAKSDDMLMVVTYNTTRNLFDTREGTKKRSQATYLLELPGTWLGDTVECWIAFVAADGKDNSSSMGEMVLV